MRGHIIGHKHDANADALYITLSDEPYAFGEDLGPERRIDYAADRTPSASSCSPSVAASISTLCPTETRSRESSSRQGYLY
jgi:hypothetical protein